VHDVSGAFESVPEGRMKGHGSADFFAIEAFVEAVAVSRLN
jgi:hypothetical protein